MASYVELEGTPLEMEFLDDKVDLLSLGVAQISTQRIVEKVAQEILTAEGILAPGWKWAAYPSRWFQPEYPRIVQVEVTKATAGSYHSVLTFAILATLSDPHVIAILHNLGANVIWAIANSGLQAIRRKISESIQISRRYRVQERDPYRIEALVRDIVLIAEQNRNIKAIRYRSGPDEVTLDLEFYRQVRR